MPLIALDRIAIAYGHLPVLDQASLQVEAGERIALIGRNGAGKSTLLQILSGDVTPDGGTVWRQPSVRTALLVQDVPLSSDRSVFDVVAEGLASARAHEIDPWQGKHRVDIVLSHLGLEANSRVDALSGGWRRRVLLARALVAEPDVLLLDEPTNHLDIEAIGWLEARLADYRGTVVFVTHDRTFLERLATRIIELDRGRLTSWPGDYLTFVRRKTELMEQESVAHERFDKRLAVEEAWLRRGVKARRTRDEGRVRTLIAMREERAARRALPGQVRLAVDRADPTGRLVFEADGVAKSFAGHPVVTGFSTRILRGDRVGLIGPNGAGKTTLLRLLLGDLMPDAGEVRRGANVQPAYYDQQREQLDPERTVFDTVGDGRDVVSVSGATRHVHAYLRDFLFSDERARSPVKALSGGERNRLLLARLFTRPVNVLVLDEPTNDLDLDTLELLEAMLADWPGTLLLVSHDRAFLDRVVTSTLAFEGEGRVSEYVGGYEDWVRQRPQTPKLARQAQDRRPLARTTSAVNVGPAAKVESAAPRKLSYNEGREWTALPSRIEALEAQQNLLRETAHSATFYQEPADTIARTLARLEAIDEELLMAYARWDELDSRRSR